MTLQDMLNEVSSYVDDTDVVSDDQSQSRIISALNRAYKRICREKYRLNTEDTIILDNTLTIDCNKLSKKFMLFNAVYDSNGNELAYTFKNTNIINLPYNQSGDTVIINYSYLPDDLKNMTDEPLLPDATVDHKLICYYAAYEYFIIDDNEQASYWLNLWNDGFNSISEQKVSQNQVNDVYGWW